MQTMEPRAPERRQFQRVPYGAWVEDLARSGSLRFFLTRNLSKGGVLLATQADSLPPVGTEVRLRLVVENEQRIVTMDGKVVRHARDRDGQLLFAVQFVGVDLARDGFLEGLVGELTGPQRSVPSA